MKIENLRKERRGDGVRIAATIAWEERDRPALELFAQTDGEFADDLEPAPEAFLTAVALPAMRRGERRILLDGPVCPRLREGLLEAMALLRSWYGAPRGPIAIESRRGWRPLPPRSPARTAAMFSGGVDATHMLLANRRDFPPGHAESIRDLVSVIGYLDPEVAEDTGPGSPYARARNALAEAARAHETTLVPIATNVMRLDPDLEFLKREWSGAAICWIVHALASRWSAVAVASSRPPSELIPEGTHPLLDPRLSSSSVEIRHVGLRHRRIEKLAEISGHPADLSRLIVCPNFAPPPYLDCGACEKCVRTMIGLEAAGALAAAAPAFPFRRPLPELLESVFIGQEDAPFWQELVGPLAARGRNDLAGAVEHRLAVARRQWRAARGRWWTRPLRGADRTFLAGALARWRARSRARPAKPASPARL